MTTEPIQSPCDPATAVAEQPKPKAERQNMVQPVLEKLFELYPHLFGAEFLPLKLGTFQDLLASHPEQFQRASLKAALGVHARSTKYLQSVAAGKQRHDLLGNAAGPVAPEHVYLAIIELYRRRQARSKEDLRPKLHRQIVAAFDASGLSREDYTVCIQTAASEALPSMEDAFAQLDQAVAKQEALRRAFEASGQSVEAFADMYGLPLHQVKTAIDHKRS
jgi:hypothetical protein